MPREIQITKYCCNVCGYSYEQYSTALMCEAAPTISEPVEYHVGDSFLFEAVDVVSPSRTSSAIETGDVLAKTFMTIKNQAGFFEHHMAYVVRCCVNNTQWMERIVVWVDKKLYSPPDFAYHEGYHKAMPKNLVVLEHIDSFIGKV